MKIISPQTFRAVLAALFTASAAHADIVTATGSLPSSEMSFSGSGTGEVMPSGALVTLLAPFDASLGTLNSFTITWSIPGQVAGTAGSGDPGSVVLSYGGSFAIDTSSFNGTGGASPSFGADADLSFSDSFTLLTIDFTFTVDNAGVTYDPAILAAVTGDSDYLASFSSSITANYSNVTDLTVTIPEGTVTMAYDFTPVPEPAISALIALGAGAFMRTRFRRDF